MSILYEGCTPLLHYQQFKTDKEVKQLKADLKETKQQIDNFNKESCNN